MLADAADEAVAGTEAVAVITVEILVEPEVVAEVRVILQLLIVAEAGAAAGFGVAQKELGEALGEGVGYFEERVQQARIGGVFHFEIVAVVVVEALQRLDEQEVGRHPDGPTPIGIAAKQRRLGFGRLVVHGELRFGTPKDERVSQVVA